MAAQAVVEAVRDPGLAWRRVDRIRRRACTGRSGGSRTAAAYPRRGGISVSRLLRFLPLLVLAAFVVAVAWRLTKPADEEIRSQLVGQPVPGFALAPALPGRAGLASTELASGQPRMINVFASWCVPCIAEAPLLLELKRQGVAIDAVAVRDRPEDVSAFLTRHGDPFDRIGTD